MNKKKILKKTKYTLRFLPDKLYLQVYYFSQFKKFINFKNPKTYNEKLNWLKIYDRNPEYTKMVDKYEGKKYVASIIGEEYIIPTLGIWNKFDDINFEQLPNQFVLKCTHDSEGIVIVKDKKKLDNKLVKDKIEEAMKYNFFYIGREYPYKNVKPRIIAEKYMEDSKYHELRDYKFFCFNGEPKIMYVSDCSHTNNQHCCFYNMKYQKLNIKRKDYKEFIKPLSKPKNFNKMIELSKILSKNIPHVRVDWYEINEKLYFGELTFYTCSGFIPFENEEWDYKIGEWIKLN